MFEELNRGFTVPSPKVYREMTPIKRREMRDGLLYISPWLIGFTIFTFLPIVASLIFSFTDINITDGIFSSPEFVGLRNYVQLFNDPQIWTGSGSGTSGSMWITIKFGLISLPIMLFRDGSTVPTNVRPADTSRCLTGLTTTGVAPPGCPRAGLPGGLNRRRDNTIVLVRMFISRSDRSDRLRQSPLNIVVDPLAS